MIMYNELWKQLFKAHLDAAEAIYRLAQEYNILDSQEFLDWQDQLNEISVRYDKENRR